MSLKDDIRAAVEKHSGDSPYTDKLPPNFNSNHRPPNLDFNDPQVIADLNNLAPRMNELIASGQMPPPRMTEILTQLRQHQRARAAEKGANVKGRPGEYMGDASAGPYLDMPFAPTDSRHPLLAKGTPAGDAMDNAVESWEASQLFNGLASKLRTREQIAQIDRRNSERPVSIHEALTAAAEPYIRDGQIQDPSDND